jgi:hypothetical protein
MAPDTRNQNVEQFDTDPLQITTLTLNKSLIIRRIASCCCKLAGSAVDAEIEIYYEKAQKKNFGAVFK